MSGSNLARTCRSVSDDLDRPLLHLLNMYSQPQAELDHCLLPTAMIAGASGLVGGIILRHLLEDPSVGEGHVLIRKSFAIRHPKLITHLVDFHAIPALPPVDEVYLALGTTITQAGTRAAFRSVDFGANLAVAKAALSSGGAKRIGLVSAHSADAKSSLFYTCVKGALEDALTALSSDTLVIARPSFLIGDRSPLNQPVRYGEKLGIWLSKLLRPILPANYRPVEALQVANVLLALVPSSSGKTIVQSEDIHDFVIPLINQNEQASTK